MINIYSSIIIVIKTNIKSKKMQKDFELIELNLLKLLSKNDKKYLNQCFLYNELEKVFLEEQKYIEDFDFKFLIIIQRIHSLYKYIEVKNVQFIVENNVNEPFLFLMFYNCNDIHFNTELKINDEMMDIFKKNYIQLPSEKAVIQYIYDNGLEDYYSLKDYDGNTFLHKIIYYNESGILKDYLFTNDLHLELNNNKETPIEFINNIKTSKIILLHIYKKQENKTFLLNRELRQFKKDCSYFIVFNYCLTVVLIVFLLILFINLKI
jgi:hypothetical protein